MTKNDILHELRAGLEGIVYCLKSLNDNNRHFFNKKL